MDFLTSREGVGGGVVFDEVHERLVALKCVTIALISCKNGVTIALIWR